MRRSTTSAMLGGFVALAFLGGCAQENLQHTKIRTNLTPELQTLNRRPVEVRSEMSLVINSDWRQFWDDAQRAMLLDRPSRLSPIVIPH